MGTEQNSLSLGWTASRLGRQVELALSSVDLSSAQYRLLVQLAQGAEASTTLARKLAVSAPSVTAVVDGLAQRGAVERTHSEEDRRKVSLALTEVGRELLTTAERAVNERLRTIVNELGDEGRAEQAFAALSIWAEALDRARAKRLAEREQNAAAGSAW